MSILDIFSKSVSSVINDEVNKLTGDLENKFENAVTGLFSKALKEVGIGGKLGRELTSRFASSIAAGKADKFLGKVQNTTNRATDAQLCENIAPRFADTAFNAANKLKMSTADLESNQSRFPMQEMKYYMRMDFQQYVRPSPQSTPKFNPKHSIILPLPAELSEQVSVNLSQESAGIAGQAGDLLSSTVNSSVSNAQLEDVIMYALAKKLNEGTSGQSGQFLGAIPNPYVTVLFSGVNLRTFTFSWKFAPKNEEESAQLLKIVKLLKQSALPAYSPGGGAGFLQYPLMCQPTLYPWASQFGGAAGLRGSEGVHPIIGFKPCLISDITVNHAPNGIPSFFAGTNLPTFYQITVSMQETSYFTAEDFGRSADADGIAKFKEEMNKSELYNDVKNLARETLNGFGAKINPDAGGTTQNPTEGNP